MKFQVVPDKQKAQSLRYVARITLERLQKTNISEYPTNTLLDYYDILHKLLEAITLTKGIKIKGDGAHQELIDYVCSKYSLSEQERMFLQQLREYRNRISYEGFIIKEAYIIKNKEKIEILIKKIELLG